MKEINRLKLKNNRPTKLVTLALSAKDQMDKHIDDVEPKLDKLLS